MPRNGLNCHVPQYTALCRNRLLPLIPFEANFFFFFFFFFGNMASISNYTGTNKSIQRNLFPLFTYRCKKYRVYRTSDVISNLSKSGIRKEYDVSASIRSIIQSHRFLL